MRKFKKLLVGILSVCSSFLVSGSVFAKPYDLIIKEDGFAKIIVMGTNESSKQEFYYICQSFYNTYKNLYTRFFGKDKAPIIINSKKIYSFVKSCGGPDESLYSTAMSLCEEIDPHRGSRDAEGEDKVFLAEYGKLDRRLADTIYDIIISENIC